MPPLKDLGNAIGEILIPSFRAYAATAFLLFAFGIIVGAQLATNNPQLLVWAVIASIVLAMLTYMSTILAVILFIIVALVLLIL